MSHNQVIGDVVTQIAEQTTTAREYAVALHHYVRDRVKFGFNKYFDASPPSYTLSFGFGHCNPKTQLMVAMFRAAGFEAWQHFVVIPRDILQGVIPPSRYWMIPAQLSHSYCEVLVEDTWCSIDSYIVDTPLLQGSLARLSSEGRSLGYGVRTGSVNTWDGHSDAFSQFAHTMLVEDHGRVDDPETYYSSSAYRNKALGVPFNAIFKLMGDFGVAPMNKYIERVRGG